MAYDDGTPVTDTVVERLAPTARRVTLAIDQFEHVPEYETTGHTITSELRLVGKSSAAGLIVKFHGENFDPAVTASRNRQLHSDCTAASMTA